MRGVCVVSVSVVGCVTCVGVHVNRLLHFFYYCAQVARSLSPQFLEQAQLPKTEN